MNICAIIAEYNPFHNGHLKQIKKAKAELHADLIAVVMSESFTQHGDIAVKNRYERAQWAIDAGADVVIGLPSVYSLAPASRFAEGAIKTLSLFGNDFTLVFGTETEELDDLQMAADFLKSESNDYKNLLHGYLSSGLSVAKSRSMALNQINPDVENMLQSPNNILAVEYMKAAAKLGVKCAFHAIPRIPDNERNIASSTKIRDMIENGKYKKFVPEYVDLSQNVTSAIKYSAVSTYALKTLSVDELQDLANISEGFENRIAKSDFNSFEEFLTLTTKRYTRSTVKRIAASAALGVTKPLVALAEKEKPYSTLLAVKNSKKKAVMSLLAQADGYFYFKPSDCKNDSPVKPLVDLDEKAAKIVELCK